MAAAVDPLAPPKPKTLQQTLADQLGDTGSMGAATKPIPAPQQGPPAVPAVAATPQVQPTTVEGAVPGPDPGPVLDGPAQPAAPGALNNNAAPRPVLLGFDADKMLDPKSGSVAGSKYTDAAKTFYQGLQANVGLSRGGLDNMVNFAKQNGFANAKAIGDDKIDFGDGNGPVDVVRSDGQIVFQNTTGNPVWEGQNGGGSPTSASGGGAQAPFDASGGGASGLPGGGGGIAGALAQSGGARDSAQAAILKLLADSQQPVDLNDPNMQLQLQARDRQGQRAQERARSMAAERAAADGTLTGGRGDGSFETELNGLDQARGEDMQDFAANLVGQEQQARRASLVQAIQMAEQSGQFDQSQALQLQLAQMDNAMKQQALNVQKYGIDTNSALQRYGIDTNAGLEGRRLDQQGSQFDTTMDYNSAQADADNYFRWVMAGLNG